MQISKNAKSYFDVYFRDTNRMINACAKGDADLVKKLVARTDPDRIADYFQIALDADQLKVAQFLLQKLFWHHRAVGNSISAVATSTLRIMRLIACDIELLALDPSTEEFFLDGLHWALSGKIETRGFLRTVFLDLAATQPIPIVAKYYDWALRDSRGRGKHALIDAILYSFSEVAYTTPEKIRKYYHFMRKLDSSITPSKIDWSHLFHVACATGKEENRRCVLQLIASETDAGQQLERINWDFALTGAIIGDDRSAARECVSQGASEIDEAIREVCEHGGSQDMMTYLLGFRHSSVTRDVLDECAVTAVYNTCPWLVEPLLRAGATNYSELLHCWMNGSPHDYLRQAKRYLIKCPDKTPLDFYEFFIQEELKWLRICVDAGGRFGRQTRANAFKTKRRKVQFLLTHGFADAWNENQRPDTITVQEIARSQNIQKNLRSRLSRMIKEENLVQLALNYL